MFKVHQDIQKRKNFKNNEIYYKVLKTLVNNQNLSRILRKNLAWNFHKIMEKNSAIFTHNYCVLTGRSKGVYKSFRLSRMILKNLVNNKLIPSLKKSSW